MGRIESPEKLLWPPLNTIKRSLPKQDVNMGLWQAIRCQGFMEYPHACLLPKRALNKLSRERHLLLAGKLTGQGILQRRRPTAPTAFIALTRHEKDFSASLRPSWQPKGLDVPQVIPRPKSALAR